jgi:protein disulfide-isomerase A1
VSSSAVAKILFPNINAKDNFIGIVKSEPEKYTAYGELLMFNQLVLRFIFTETAF